LLDRHRGEKDTLTNIRKTAEFVVNIVSHELTAKMNQTSAPYAEEVNEFEQAGLTSQPSVMVKAPGVLESKVRFECTLQQVISFGDAPLAGNLVLGEIRHIYLHPYIYKDGRVDVNALDTVGRLAGNFYSTIRDQFEIARP
jgi:flavin reductase (DIM6/NTAB) family NADH-FMN oxidoreductase RutF